MELKGPEIAYGEAVMLCSPDSGNVVGWSIEVGGTVHPVLPYGSVKSGATDAGVAIGYGG